MDWFQAIEGEPAGILVADRDGRVTYANPAATRALGEPPVGRPVRELLEGYPLAAGSPAS